PPLSPSRSSRETSILHGGSLAQRELHIFTGLNEFGAAQFDLVGMWIYQNDSLGHPTNIVWIDGSTAVSRSIYTADYRGTNTFDGDLLLWEKDQQGIKTLYTYDSLKRLIASRHEGIAASGAYPS